MSTLNRMHRLHGWSRPGRDSSTAPPSATILEPDKRATAIVPLMKPVSCAGGFGRRDSHPWSGRKLYPLLSVVVLAPLLLAFTPGLSAAAQAADSSHRQVAATGSTPYPATGYFSVAQKTGGGWTLVTPQGEPFYASGIDTVAPDGSGTDQTTGQCPYCRDGRGRLPEPRRLGAVDGLPAPFVGVQLPRGLLRRCRPRLPDAVRGPAVHGQRGRLVRPIVCHECRPGGGHTGGAAGQ